MTTIEFQILNSIDEISVQMSENEIKLFISLLQNPYIKAFQLEKISLIEKKGEVYRIKIGDTEFSSEMFYCY